MPRIKMLQDDELSGDIGKTFATIKANHPTGQVPPIYRTMSLNPAYFAAIKQAAEAVHFTDGALTRAQHELIASYVSALNHCRY